MIFTTQKKKSYSYGSTQMLNLSWQTAMLVQLNRHTHKLFVGGGAVCLQEETMETLL